MNLDAYYQHCEDAIRCQALGNTLGVTCHLLAAVKVRDELVRQAQTRLELGQVQDLLDYWEGTLSSLTYAERTGVAAIYIPPSLDSEGPGVNP